jgi:hypothetical protein
MMVWCKVLFFFSQVILVISSPGPLVNQCSFDNHEGRVLACGKGAGASKCPRIRKEEEYKIQIINYRIRDFHNSFYDVHAYRLCGSERPDEVTLQDAMRRGQLCQEKRKSGIFRNLIFEGCGEYFNDGPNKDLTIYAYSDVNGCNGDLFYRFLLINGTGIDHYSF